MSRQEINTITTEAESAMNRFEQLDWQCDVRFAHAAADRFDALWQATDVEKEIDAAFERLLGC